MLRRYLSPLLAISVAALALAPSASAQGRMRGGMMGGMFGGNNPAQSAAMTLLQRTDVQNELHMDLNQKNAMTELQTSSQADMRTQMQQTFQGLQGLTGPERQQKMQELMPQIQQQMATFQGALTDKMAKILHPDQMKRLHQLDLQWRGPLSMADPKVATEIDLSAEHKTAVAAAATEFQTQSNTDRQTFFQGLRTSGVIQQGQRPDPAAMATAMAPFLKKTAELKDAAGKKVVEMLSPEEKGRWTAAIGAPFMFRKDLP